MTPKSTLIPTRSMGSSEPYRWKVLVTGAAGLIGVPLVRQLVRLGHGVAAVDDGSAGTLPRLEGLAGERGIRCWQLDVRDRASLARVVRHERPWAVVHLAARHYIPDCERHPAETYEVNVLGTANLLAACAACPPRRLIFASTADVYQPSGMACRETDPTGAIGVYGASKLAAESLVRSRRAARTSWTIVRIGNAYGPGDPWPHLIPELLSQAAQGDRLRLGNLDSARDYVFVDDVARALARLLVEGDQGVCNLGTGVATTGATVLKLVAELLNRPLVADRDPGRVRLGDRNALFLDPTRLRGVLGPWPSVDLRSGLRRMLVGDATGQEIAQDAALSPASG